MRGGEDLGGGVVLLLLWLALAPAAEGHPGGLNEYGCHMVRTPYTYANGQDARPWTYHCHRGLDALRLDDALEQLQEDPRERAPVTPSRRRRDARPPARPPR